MIALVGIAFIFIMVFGGYLLAGGKLGIILKALPFEMMMIGGAAIGAFAIGNSFLSIRQTLSDLGYVFKGSRWKAVQYQELMELLYTLLDLAQKDPMALEAHIDDPKESTIFQKFPTILKDSEATDMMCDTLRSATMNFADPHQVEPLLEKKISDINRELLHSVHGLQSIADGLPALGIVAAVLGVIKTMGSIDQPPEVLGKLIGGALVGTFLGVFLAYCLVAPFAAKLKAVADDDISFYAVIKDVLILHLNGNSAKMAIEAGRQSIPHEFRPDFATLDEVIRTSKVSV